MEKTIIALLFGVIAILLGLFSGVLQVGLPELPDPTEQVIEVEPTEARIIEITPIHLDCRALVRAEVPVEATKEHKLLSKTYRTDVVTMTAIGDVEVCVEGEVMATVEGADGKVQVTIPASSIVFNRPRVDAVASAASVEVNKGLVGKITDSGFWVSDDLGLTPLAYAYAQNVIGSSECMSAAYEVASSIVVDAYEAQAIEQGATSAEVWIHGAATFPIPEPLDIDEDTSLALGDGSVSCEVIQSTEAEGTLQ